MNRQSFGGTRTETNWSDLGSPRVLVAAAPRTHARIARVLLGCGVEFVADSADAAFALAATAFDFVVVGISVQESRAIELLEKVRTVAPRAPVICVRASEPKLPMPASSLEVFRLASGQLGSAGLVDFLDFSDDLSGDLAIRAEIDALIRGHPARRVRGLG